MEEVVQALAASGKKSRKTPTKRDAAIPPTPPSSRCTRSQAAPDWTVQETLILVGVIVAVDEDWLKALSSYQKWKMISDNCMALDVNRSLNQCKRRWESLLADYGKISDWESRHGVCSYWSLDSERRKQYDLPSLFDHEVFDSINAVIKEWEDRSASEDDDSEDLVGTADIEMIDAGVDSGPRREGTHSKSWKDTEKAREMASKLQQTAEQVHAVLRGELKDDASRGRALVDLTKPNAMETEFTRRQADELIRAFGDLAGTLNQFADHLEDGGR